MQGWMRRATGASVVGAALLVGAAAAHAAGLGVTEVSSLAAGAKRGNLSGLVRNDGARAARADVVVRAMRYGTGGQVVGRTSVDVAAHGAKRFLVSVQLPALAKGTYYLSACTPVGGPDTGKLGCATSARDILVKGGDPLRGPLAQKQFDARAGAAQAQCGPGARTLSNPGDRVWPELGNGGYQSLHTDVFTLYDAVANLLLPGNHVELTQKATQRL